MSVYDSLYQSAVHHPGVAWLSAALMLIVVCRKLPFLQGFALVALAVSAADAIISGGWGPRGGESHALYKPLTFCAVIVGDLRMYALARRVSERGDAPQGWGSWRVWLGALGLTMIPTLVIVAMDRIFPGFFDTPRHIFLIYELLFLGVAVSWGLLWLPRALRAQSSQARRWAYGVVALQCTGYALWALADALILVAQQPWALALRMIPNAIYYGAFVPAVWWLAPASLTQREL